MGKLYDEDSIKSLDPLHFTRLRPGVYVGSTENSNQLLLEVIANAIDEYRAGHGNLIKVNINGTRMSVRDYGQGFLVGSMREDGTSVLEASFSVFNTSGKYDSDGVYEGTALGLNGIGSKLANFLSHELTVTTWRDGKSERVVFKEGVFESREINNSEKDEHGTLVCWEPSEEFFTTPEIDLPPIQQFLSTIVCLCSGLTIKIDYTNSDGSYHYTDIFHSDNGINDLIDAAVGDKEIFNNRFFINFKSGKYQMDLALTYTSNYSSTIVPYVNTGLTDSGPHITQIKTALTRELNKFFREKKWLKEKDENLSGDDTQEGLYLVFNMTAPDVGYDAQTKSRIVRLNTLPFIQAFAEEFPKWLAVNEKMVKGLADKAINARKAREAARKAREAVRNKGEKSKAFNLPTKLVDAWSKERSKCELVVCEGK